jgi:hypothetical protein
VLYRGLCWVFRSESKTDASSRAPKRRASSRSPQRSPKATGSGAGSRKIDYGKLPLAQLVDDFNAPAISKSNHALFIQDITTRFPNLYIPTDFVKLEVSVGLWS